MKSPIILLLALLSFSLSCSSGGSSADRATNSQAATATAQPFEAPKEAAKTVAYDNVQQQKIALTDVDKVGASAEALERKIIRNAEITMEVASTTDAQHKVTSI